MNKIINKESIKYVEDNKVLAEVNFPLTENNVIIITRTFVDDSLRGQGIAKKLMLDVIDIANKNNYKIKATCSYAVSYFSKNNCDLYIN